MSHPEWFQTLAGCTVYESWVINPSGMCIEYTCSQWDQNPSFFSDDNPVTIKTTIKLWLLAIFKNAAGEQGTTLQVRKKKSCSHVQVDINYHALSAVSHVFIYKTISPRFKYKYFGMLSCFLHAWNNFICQLRGKRLNWNLGIAYIKFFCWTHCFLYKIGFHFSQKINFILEEQPRCMQDLNSILHNVIDDKVATVINRHQASI